MSQTISSSDPKPLTWLYWSVIGITVLAGVLVGAAFWLAARAQTEAEWLHHTLLVRNQIASVLTLVQRAESGQRGYLLTGRDTYVAPYSSAIAIKIGGIGPFACRRRYGQVSPGAFQNARHALFVLIERTSLKHQRK